MRRQKTFEANLVFALTKQYPSAYGETIANIALNTYVGDFPSKGSLALKAWFGNNQGVNLPEDIDTPIVEAISPYNEQIAALDKQVGAHFRRETLKDASGASMMDPKTQVSKINNVSILDASTKTFEANLVFALTKSGLMPLASIT